MEKEMECRGISVAAHNIVSPLGLSSADNLEAVLDGRTGIEAHSDVFGLPEPFHASLFDRHEIDSIFDRICLPGHDGYSFFEKLCLISMSFAASSINLDMSRDDVLFIISTTKGNVEFIEDNPDDERARLGWSASAICDFFGNPNRPVVVSNACISGVAAQICGARELIASEKYRYAVVVGCDVLSRFIISGFQAFKALAPEICSPFDSHRCGLNLGEAAATIILTNDCPDSEVVWRFAGGSLHNDANHISGPSRTAEGAFLVLNDILRDVNREELAFVNVHGTATPYNDEMESIALHRADLNDIPVSGVKANYGHTLGAAGILETILSIEACDKGVVLPVKGFKEPGTSYRVKVSSLQRPTDKSCFIKIISGFGGSNAGISYRKGILKKDKTTRGLCKFGSSSHVIITPGSAKLNGKEVVSGTLVDMYRSIIGDYPKFYKMDGLCRLGIIASEILLKNLPSEAKRNLSIILFNSESSLAADRKYQSTLSPDNYFPSPALFVYTLANIVTGEIAIRHKIQGETSFYVLSEYDSDVVERIVANSLRTSCESAEGTVTAVLYGWLDYRADNDFLADLTLLF